MSSTQSPTKVTEPFDLPKTTEECLAQPRGLSNKVGMEIAQVGNALTCGSPSNKSVPKLCLGVRVPLELAHEDLTRISQLLQNLKHDLSDDPPAGSLPVPHHRPSCEWCECMYRACLNIEQCATGLKRLSTSFSYSLALEEASGNIENIYNQMRLLGMILEDLETRMRGDLPEGDIDHDLF